MAAVRHISQWPGRMVAAQRVPARMVAVRRMAVAAGIAAGRAATAIEPSTAVGKYHPGVEKASSVQIKSDDPAVKQHRTGTPTPIPDKQLI